MLTKPEANLAYPNYPLTLEEGEQLLTDAIHQFHGSTALHCRGVGALYSITVYIITHSCT